MDKTKLEQTIIKLREAKNIKALKKLYEKLMDMVYPKNLNKPLKNAIVVNDSVFDQELDTWEYAVYIAISKFNLFDSTDDEGKFKTSEIAIESLYIALNIPFNKHRGEYKNKIKQALYSLQKRGLITLEYLTAESQKDARLFIVHQAEHIEDVTKRYTLLSLESVQKIICNVDKVDTRMKMLQVFLSVHKRMWFSKHASMDNPICYENLGAIAKRVGLTEDQASKYLKALVDLKALASFNVLRMGKNKNYYSRIEHVNELKGHILYEIEKITYIKLDYKNIEKALKAKNRLYKEDSSIDAVNQQDNSKKLKDLKEFADFLKKKQYLVQCGYPLSDLHNMFQKEREEKQELLADDSLDDVEDFEEIFN